MHPGSTQNRSPHLTWPLAFLALALLTIAGCGSDEESDAPEGVSTEQTSAIEVGMSSDEVVETLGEPLLTSGPTTEYPEGCVYYAVADGPPTSAWQFCFDEGAELAAGTSVEAPAQSAPPEDAAPARAALVGLGDATCRADYRKLNEITKRLTTALGEYEVPSTEKNRETVGDLIGDFIENLEGTHEKLAAFEAPDEEADALGGYVESLGRQLDVLDEARTAFLEEDLKTYNDRGDEFTEIGKTATGQAQQYGFAYCSASDFG